MSKQVESKTVLTKAGPVTRDIPRDRAGTFEPRIVAKRQRRLGSVEDIVGVFVGARDDDPWGHLRASD